MKLQEFRRFGPSVVVQPQRAQLLVPAFTLAAVVWGGSSIIIAEYPLGNTAWISLKVPVDAFGSSFVAAVRYVEDGAVIRFVLWEHEDAVLYYPVYSGERLGAGAILEIWSVNSALAPTLLASKTLESSILAFPANCSACCENPTSASLLTLRGVTTIDPYAYCNPFCLPLEV